MRRSVLLEMIISYRLRDELERSSGLAGADSARSRFAAPVEADGGGGCGLPPTAGLVVGRVSGGEPIAAAIAAAPVTA